MRHPELPDSPPIEIAETAVPQHQSQGWFEVEPPPPPPKPELKDEADGEQPRGESSTPRRPAKKKGED
jgi:hypothetical protein